jgi:hypothetical protein
MTMSDYRYPAHQTQEHSSMFGKRSGAARRQPRTPRAPKVESLPDGCFTPHNIDPGDGGILRHDRPPTYVGSVSTLGDLDRGAAK